MQVIIMASEKYYHCLNPFMYLWNKYASFFYYNLVVIGFSQPDTEFPDCFTFHSLGDQSYYPPNKWSDKLIKVIDNEIAEEQFILMPEDRDWETPITTKL